VDVASVEDNLQVTASRNVKLVADKMIADCAGPYDCIALPVHRFQLKGSQSGESGAQLLQLIVACSARVLRARHPA
jgi:hypothetical protein